MGWMAPLRHLGAKVLVGAIHERDYNGRLKRNKNDAAEAETICEGAAGARGTD